jgi:hypothetical protein
MDHAKFNKLADEVGHGVLELTRKNGAMMYVPVSRGECLYIVDLGVYDKGQWHPSPKNTTSLVVAANTRYANEILWLIEEGRLTSVAASLKPPPMPTHCFAWCRSQSLEQVIEATLPLLPAWREKALAHFSEHKPKVEPEAPKPKTRSKKKRKKRREHTVSPTRKDRICWRCKEAIRPGDHTAPSKKGLYHLYCDYELEGGRGWEEIESEGLHWGKVERRDPDIVGSSFGPFVSRPDPIVDSDKKGRPVYKHGHRRRDGVWVCPPGRALGGESSSQDNRWNVVFTVNLSDASELRHLQLPQDFSPLGRYERTDPWWFAEWKEQKIKRGDWLGE